MKRSESESKEDSRRMRSMQQQRIAYIAKIDLQDLSPVFRENAVQGAVFCVRRCAMTHCAIAIIIVTMQVRTL